MCGIVGVLSADAQRPPALELVRAMAELIAHRGPDDDGFLTDPGVALGMRRLSIIDVVGGRQPVFSEDGQVAVVYNGEIYNFLALRAELEARGHRFRTQSDTEVIAVGYQEYGEAIIPRLHGMFALALWDGRARKLLLARDRLGKKPLHYCALPGRLLFASEIKALLLDPSVPRDIDIEALDDFVTYGYVLGPRTIFSSVRKLPPAHYLTWQDGRLALTRYWDATFTCDDPRPADELVDELRALLSDAVRIRLMSDVPLGAFLSGGLDSSTVVAYMSHHLAGPVKTFSVGFDEPEFDELEHARAVARCFGTDHHELVVRPNLLDDLPDLIWQLDEPFADESAIPTWYLSRAARGSVTVALCGDGGDESFGGYERYANLEGGPLVRYVPAWARRAVPIERLVPLGVRGYARLRRAWLSPAQRYADEMSGFPAPYRRRLYTPELAARLAGRDSAAAYLAPFEEAARYGPVTGAQHADFLRYLPDDILVKADRMSMLASLEVRSPLLDHRIVEFMARLPAHWKVHRGETKRLLRMAVAPLLPPAILARPKMGFGVPLNHWFRGSLTTFMRDVLTSPTARGRGVFRAAFVERLIRQHQRGVANHQHRLWTLMCFELWARTYLDGESWRQRPRSALSGGIPSA